MGVLLAKMGIFASCNNYCRLTAACYVMRDVKFLWNRLWIWVRNILIFFFVSSILAVLVFKWLPVYRTPLMYIRYCEQYVDGKTPTIKHQWVDLDQISNRMPAAVISSEDANFMDHSGFDEKAILQARLAALEGGRERGASSISQQTAKNVFLWPGHSWIRKGLEAYFTLLIEKIWGKERIMEVYLNSIEMGDGIYGVQACANENFNKDACDLTKNDAALIAATLPNPLVYDSANPSRYMEKRRKSIVAGMNYLRNAGLDPKWGVEPKEQPVKNTSAKKKSKKNKSKRKR